MLGPLAACDGPEEQHRAKAERGLARFCRQWLVLAAIEAVYCGAKLPGGIDRSPPQLARALFAVIRSTDQIAAITNKQLRMPPHISTSKWSSRSALSRIETKCLTIQNDSHS